MQHSNRTRTSILALLLPGLLSGVVSSSGCGPSKQYERPADPLPKTPPAKVRAAGREKAEAKRRLIEGHRLQETGNCPAAREEFTKARILDESLTDAAFGVAQCLELEGETTQALTMYRQSVAENPYDSASLTAIGRLMEERGEHREALSHYERAVAANPAQLEARVGAARELRRFNERERAVVELKRAVEIQPACAECFDDLADLSKELGRASDAAEYRHRANFLRR